VCHLLVAVIIWIFSCLTVVGCHCFLNGNDSWQSRHQRTTIQLPLLLSLYSFFSSCCNYGGHCLFHLVDCSLLAVPVTDCWAATAVGNAATSHLASLSPMLQHTMLVLLAASVAVHAAFAIAGIWLLLFVVFLLLLLSICCRHHLSWQQTFAVCVLRRPRLHSVGVVFQEIYLRKTVLRSKSIVSEYIVFRQDSLSFSRTSVRAGYFILQK